MILSGGNVDPLILSRIIEKGLVADGRLCRFTAVVPDRPGGLARLTQLIAQSGASIQEITHDRAFAGPEIGEANVLCTVETADRDHRDELYDLLKREGIRAAPLRFPSIDPDQGTREAS
jgi:threonine dehydratase